MGGLPAEPFSAGDQPPGPAASTRAPQERAIAGPAQLGHQQWNSPGTTKSRPGQGPDSARESGKQWALVRNWSILRPLDLTVGPDAQTWRNW